MFFLRRATLIFRDWSTIKPLDMPDVPCIFQYRAIPGEIANTRHLQDRLLCPNHWGLICLTNGVLCVNIGWQVSQMKIVITLQERSSNPSEQTWLMRAEEVRGEGVDDVPDGWIACVIRLRVIAAMGTQLPNFLGLQAEDKDIFLADLLHDLNIGTIERADGQGTIHRELHVTRPRSFGPGSRNVFAEIGSGDDLFR